MFIGAPRCAWYLLPLGSMLFVVSFFVTLWILAL
jgi:hypothetical protein